MLEAMGKVPRHWFVPEAMQEEAYADRPLPIGFGQTISQPYVVAVMTDLLDPQPHWKILEVGTGSGFQAAVLTQFTPDIYTMEVIAPLHEQALPRLEKFGLGPDRVLLGDGNAGLPAAAPFDGIMVTAAATKIPPALVQQLKRGGRMVIPIGESGIQQRLIVLEKNAGGKVSTRDVLPVQFVPLTGGGRTRPGV
ncbi:MAG: protein-L-isoaspartate(D-aspartate) O-methyltransferase [Verrucomicrobiota bacterium]|nr:protein-L-isoaspartate(D-aspartate) O-methyltransferase [Verrucomicrobiota bacterium]